MVTDEQVQAAEALFQEKRRKIPFARKAYYDPTLRLIVVEYSAGFSISFAPERALGLAGASDADLSEIEISSGGYGIYFPKLDADFSVEEFRVGRFGTDQWEREWAGMHREMQAA